MVDSNFQAESKKSGDDFEALVLQDLVSRGVTDIEKNVYMPETGCEVDFLAKGLRYEYVECKGGKQGDNKRPGAKRTDNVKKAIANGALIKSCYPNAKFIIYFSDMPKRGSSSDKMIREAIKANYIDTVIYLIEV